VNDDPVNTVPGTQLVAEETATAITGISVSDLDAASSNVTTRLQVTAGALNVTLSGSASISAGTNGTGDLTILGSVVDINGTLASLTYTGNAEVVGTNADTITVTTNDLGNSGSGGAQSDVDTVQIDISPVNDTPSVTGPGTAYTINEQTNLNIHGTGFSVTDVDAASATMTATFVTGEGSIALSAGDSGVAIVSNNAGTVSFTGNLAQINALVTGSSTGTILYNNGSDTPSASTSIELTVNDGGNTGTDPGLTADGLSEEDSASQTINITAVNDNPSATGLVSDITVTEDLLSNVDLSALNFTDVDAGSASLTVTLSTSTGGELTLAADGSLVFGGTATARTITGSLADLNTYFDTPANVQYLHDTVNTNGNDADTISVVINDNNNTGIGGGANQNIGTVNVDITSVNDFPTTVNANSTVGDEDDASILISVRGEDIDGNVDNIRVTSLPANGTLYADSGLSTAVVVGADYATTAESRAFYFVPDADWNGTTSFNYAAHDDEGGIDASPATGTYIVAEVNDTPVRTAGTVSNLNVSEDSGVTGLGLGAVAYSVGGGSDESSHCE